MTAKVIHCESIQFPALRLIGKEGSDWGQWWANGWFARFEAQDAAVDPDYIGCIHDSSYWIGMLFPADYPVPDGFACIDLPAQDYVLCFLYGKEDDSSLYGEKALSLCQTAAREAGFIVSDGDYLERYNCPRFTTPDDHGMVIIDYLLPQA